MRCRSPGHLSHALWTPVAQGLRDSLPQPSNKHDVEHYGDGPSTAAWPQRPACYAFEERASSSMLPQLSIPRFLVPRAPQSSGCPGPRPLATVLCAWEGAAPTRFRGPEARFLPAGVAVVPLKPAQPAASALQCSCFGLGFRTGL